MPYQGRLPYTYKSPYNYTLDQGTQTVPSLAFLGDTNNGLFSPATDNVAITTNGSEKLRVTSAGNVGIGTTNPGTKLDVDGAITSRLTGTSGGFRLHTNSGIVASDNVVRFFTGQTYGFNFNSNTTGDSTSPLMSITLSGNVGIGTTDPTQPLHIKKSVPTIRIEDSTGSVDFTTNSAGEGVIRTNQATPFRFFTNSLERVRISETGNVGIGATSPNAKLVVSASGTAGMEINPGSPSASSGTLIEHYNRSTALYTHVRTIASEHRFDINATEALRISPSGNVGIGTTNPEQKLHVLGNLRLGTDPYIQWVSNYIKFQTTTASVPVIELRESSSGNYEPRLDFYDGNGTTKNISIDANPSNSTYFNAGNVGIGTTNPGFRLEVNGSFAATTKSFVIPHPSKPNYQLRYACLEGPENSVYVRGRTQENVIELPDYWVDLVHEDSITVSITSVGNKRIWIEEINSNKVYINSEDTIDCHYIVFAERKDVEKLVVEIEEN